jgi:hypothetical protein
METFRVTVATPAGEFEVEVPTFQGAGAASRRAFFAVAAMVPAVDLDEMEVVSVEAV